MTPRQFFDKVAIMRKYQQEYFRTRSKAALNQSKQLEREIDDEIKRVKQITGAEPDKPFPEQKSLFDK